jgi:excisionase family DNA binding protein
MGLKEVAEVLGTNWKNVRDLVEAGELPCVRVGASQEPKVALETLQAWLRAMGDAAGRAAGEQTHRTVRRRSA